MLLVLVAWLYVTVLMALAEATAPRGSLAGALATLVFYGLLPGALMGYFLLRARRKRRSADAQGAAPPPSGLQPDTGGHAPAAAQGDGVAPVREEP
ncbi:hypothetical protein [Comamonas flocculans]|uniref:Uncharacterized protein n=1 Tax=Comamonas flocculans TaxID=2597701 RepID=A0A5B8RX12_9BURK|nr:hypothetical protein [Comamonas flocculans]QEA14169.1 hypothetical protein FOZ74_14665 [Comamonas flocculans]